MVEVTGLQLGAVWDEMTPDLKLKIMREIVSIKAKMLPISFSQYVLVLQADHIALYAVVFLLISAR